VISPFEVFYSAGLRVKLVFWLFLVH